MWLHLVYGKVVSQLARNVILRFYLWRKFQWPLLGLETECVEKALLVSAFAYREMPTKGSQQILFVIC